MSRRTDTNQKQIVAELRRLGIGVADLSAVGGGVPDLLIGCRWANLLVEVKQPPGPKGGTSHRKLTPQQKVFHATWPGPILVADSTEQVLRWIGSFGKGNDER